MKFKKIVLLTLLFVGITLDLFSQFSVQNCQKSPIYKDNGGWKKTNLINKGKVKREAALLVLCDLFRKMEDQIKSNVKTDYANKEKDAIYLEKERAIIETNSKLLTIAKKLEGNKITSAKDYEELLEILKELRELKCREVDPITKFLDKRVNRIYGDISFKTGSSEISIAGKNEIAVIIKELISDINDWKAFVSDCNEKVFENDLFVLVIDIDGYADQQGSAGLNLTLSQKRADAVKLEMIRQLNDLVVNKRINLVFDKIQSRGFGETLPPGNIETGANDPKRRICMINSLVGPARLLKL